MITPCDPRPHTHPQRRAASSQQASSASDDPTKASLCPFWASQDGENIWTLCRAAPGRAGPGWGRGHRAGQASQRWEWQGGQEGREVPDIFSLQLSLSTRRSRILLKYLLLFFF